MGKNIKSYATIPTLHSLGKGGKPHGKKSQSIGFKTQLNHAILGSPSLKLRAKFSFSKFLFQSKLQQIMQILHIPTIPMNYTKSATKLIHISSILSDS